MGRFRLRVFERERGEEIKGFHGRSKGKKKGREKERIPFLVLFEAKNTF